MIASQSDVALARLVNGYEQARHVGAAQAHDQMLKAIRRMKWLIFKALAQRAVCINTCQI